VLALAFGQESPDPLEIHLAGNSEREAEVAEKLVALSHKHDLEPWLFTKRVRVESGAIPRSHPVLTLNTRHLGSPDQLLAVFLHEQIHWFLAAPENRDSREAALAELRAIYPEVPNAETGGAADVESTYLHLLVNWLEFRALVQLLGPEEARVVMETKDIYEWIYGRILTDGPRLEFVIDRHGLGIAHDRR